MKPDFYNGYLKSQTVMSRMYSGMIISKRRQNVEAAIHRNLKESGHGE
jgi:hypothetical protein